MTYLNRFIGLRLVLILRLLHPVVVCKVFFTTKSQACHLFTSKPTHHYTSAMCRQRGYSIVSLMERSNCSDPFHSKYTEKLGQCEHLLMLKHVLIKSVLYFWYLYLTLCSALIAFPATMPNYNWILEFCGSFERKLVTDNVELVMKKKKEGTFFKRKHKWWWLLNWDENEKPNDYLLAKTFKHACVVGSWASFCRSILSLKPGRPAGWSWLKVVVMALHSCLLSIFLLWGFIFT